MGTSSPCRTPPPRPTGWRSFSRTSRSGAREFHESKRVNRKRMNRSAVTIALAILAGVTGVAPGRASAQEPDVTAPAAPPVTTSPAQLLGDADAAIEAGNLDAAAALYDQLAREYPGAPEAHEARRALKI